MHFNIDVGMFLRWVQFFFLNDFHEHDFVTLCLLHRRAIKKLNKIPHKMLSYIFFYCTVIGTRKIKICLRFLNFVEEKHLVACHLILTIY